MPLKPAILSCMSAKSLHLCLIAARQAPLSTGFSRQEHWSGLPRPPPGVILSGQDTNSGNRTTFFPHCVIVICGCTASRNKWAIIKVIVGSKPGEPPESNLKWAGGQGETKEGEGNGNPLQCSCLEKPMDRGAWQATAQRGTHN